MRVESRAVSDRAELMPPFELPDTGGAPLTLRELIELSLRHGSGRFARRRGEHPLAEILDADPDQDTTQALAAAVEAFAAGVYLVLVDGTSCRDLDAEVALTPRSTIAFVRLSDLAG